MSQPAPASIESEVTEGVFPLPLVAFESMAVYDNWQHYPMSCGAIFTMQGEIQRDAFDRAVEFSSKRHPLLRSRLVRRRFGTTRWVPAAPYLKPKWIDGAEPRDFSACRPFDLRTENGVRIWVQQRGPIGKVFVEFHHACCDGAGGMSFMDDVFASYDAFVRGETADLPPLDIELLKTRGKFGPKADSLAERGYGFLWGLKRTATMALRRPKTLACADRPAILSRQSWANDRMITRTLDQSVYKCLRATAVEQEATLNDYLVGSLFRSLRRWNERFRPTERGWLRILIPVNLRNRRDLKMPLANRLSYAFVSRRSEQITDDPGLPKSVSNETARLNRLNFPQKLLSNFEFMKRTRTWRFIFSPKRCLATAVFSNLGDPTRRFRTRFPRQNGLVRIGNLLLTNFEGATALRPMTRAGIFVNTYGNRINISTRFDPNHYTVADAEAFLDLFVDTILAEQSAVDATRREAA